MFGRKRKKEKHAHRVWSLDHVVSRSKSEAVKKEEVNPKKKPRSLKPKPRKPRGKVLTREDDFEAILKMEKELAKEAKKNLEKQKEKEGAHLPKPGKPEKPKALAREDDLEAILKMEEALARKEKKPVGKKKAGKPAVMKKPKGKGILHFLKPKLHKPKKPKKPVPLIKPAAKKEQIKTQIDEMVNIVMEKKKAKVDYLARKLKVPEANIMEWAEILESDGMITIHYPAFGKPELRVKE